jgi:hypothetical protein
MIRFLIRDTLHFRVMSGAGTFQLAPLIYFFFANTNISVLFAAKRRQKAYLKLLKPS